MCVVDRKKFVKFMLLYPEFVRSPNKRSFNLMGNRIQQAVMWLIKQYLNVRRHKYNIIQNGK